MIKEYSLSFSGDMFSMSSSPLTNREEWSYGDMDSLLSFFAEYLHYQYRVAGMNEEQLVNVMMEGGCDRPDCKYHPWTYGLTQEQVDEQSEKRNNPDGWINPFKKFVNFDD